MRKPARNTAVVQRAMQDRRAAALLLMQRHKRSTKPAPHSPR